MKIKLVQLVEGAWITSEFENEEKAVIAFAFRGFDLAGENRKPHQRAELQGAPLFTGLCGPMWDGDAIRYEDAAAYRAMSI